MSGESKKKKIQNLDIFKNVLLILEILTWLKLQGLLINLISLVLEFACHRFHQWMVFNNRQKKKRNLVDLEVRLFYKRMLFLLVSLHLSFRDSYEKNWMLMCLSHKPV